jgi:hypothetical protein
MPCGGILPIYHFAKGFFPPEGGRCWICKKAGAKHYLEEFDVLVHARCSIYFLTTPEGDVIMDHGHIVLLDFAQEKDQEEEEDSDKKEEEEEIDEEEEGE